MKLGIIQGRLTPSVDGHIQEFPIDAWEKEFDIIKKLNLNHIEWILTTKSIFNGVLNFDIKKYSPFVSSICCDNLITPKIFNNKFFITELKRVCTFANNNNIKTLTIPLLEESELTFNNKNYIFNAFKKIGCEYKNLNFVFELDCDPILAQDLTLLLDNFFLVFDTGNITTSGYNTIEWLNMNYDKIVNVHLKDRTITPIETVPPFTGDVNFIEIFNFLANKKYNNLFTLQTARERENDEVNTITHHIKQFTNLFYEKSI